MGGRLRSLDALIGTIRNAEALGWNLYLNANPTVNRPGKKKLSRKDVTHWRYVVIDLDPGSAALIPPRPGLELGEGDTADCLLNKAHRIFSGRGYQYWLPIKGALSYLEHPRLMHPWINAESYERGMRGYLAELSKTSDTWAPGWIVDTTCSDLARVVRCPGSMNQKTGRRAVVEHMSQDSTDVRDISRYSVPDTEHWTNGLKLENPQSLSDILPHLTVTARRFILEGVRSPGRHTACWSTAMTLKSLGVPAPKALEWLMVGSHKCWEYNVLGMNSWFENKPLTDSEVKQIIKQVYNGA